MSRAGQWLNGGYSTWFNRRHGRCGHLFQGRFKAVILDPQEWDLGLSRYVHLNPVRIRSLGLGKSDRRRMSAGPPDLPPQVVKQRMGRLRPDRWSSTYIGLCAKPAWLEGDADSGVGRREERATKAKRPGVCRISSASGSGEEPVGGSEGISSAGRGRISAELAPVGQRRRSGTARSEAFSGCRASLAGIIARLERVREEKGEAFRDRYADSGRDLVLYLERRECGLTLKELAQAVGLEGDKAAATAIKRYGNRLRANKAKRAPRARGGNCGMKRCDPRV